MTRKITSELTVPLILSLADPLASGGADDPLIITSAGAIVTGGSPGSSSPTNAITAPAGTDWIIRNDGLISSANGWGIDLLGGGIIDNAGLIEGGGIAAGSFASISNTGTIEGWIDAIDLNGSGVVDNSGKIYGQGPLGIDINGGGIVRNLRGGSIFGDWGGSIWFFSGFGVISNQGSISGGLWLSINLEDGGIVTNLRGGSILGSKVAILVSGGTGVVTNEGTIWGSDFGVSLGAGGSVSNLAGAQMAAVETGGGFGTVSNQGTIASSALVPGIWLTEGGLVQNRGQIIGNRIYPDASIDITGGPGTVVNAGTISGSTTSVLFGDAAVANRIIVDPGAVFTGEVVADGGIDNTIELAKGEGAIGSIGYGSFSGFNTLVADAGSNWTLSGGNTIGDLLNDGVLDITNALTVSTGVETASNGLFQIAEHASLYIQADAGTQSAIAFTPQSGLPPFVSQSELVIGNFAAFGQDVGSAGYAGPLLMDFGAWAEIDLVGFSPHDFTHSFSAATGLLQLSDGAHAATLEFETSTLGTHGFHFAGDGAGGLLVTIAPG